MTKYQPPDQREAEIIRSNGMDPQRYTVFYRDGDCIRMLNFKTRDMVTIHRGDRPWPEACGGMSI